ncbi:hypothetical protein Btru_074125 [Bulinus truncatus]|nr:hypothetical protein Btru_074125 [Bulinus truncatus]
MLRTTEIAQRCSQLERTGYDCRFVCRCAENRCQPTGECYANAACDYGYFGYACQYVDVARGAGIRQDFHVLTDDNGQTCLSNQKTLDVNISIQPNRFTFAHLEFRNQSYLDLMGDFEMTLLNRNVSVPCLNMSLIMLKDNVLEVHCRKTAHVTTVRLTGSIIPYLCTVYISGGRNMAIDNSITSIGEHEGVTKQTLVDGKYDYSVNSNYPISICYHSLVQRYSHVILSFTQPHLVDRVKIYNRLGFQGRRTENFRLVFLNSTNGVLYNHLDKQGIRNVYTVFFNGTSPVSKLQLFSTKDIVGESGNILNVCEIEAYGECNTGTGLNCSTPCDSKCGLSGCNVQGMCRSCLSNRTGSVCESKCPDHCHRIYHSLVCHRFTFYCLHGCEDQFYGDECALECSDGCKDNTTCDRKSGNCTKGCDEGIYGPTCSLQCSINCKNSVCDQNSGKCTLGCVTGYYGELCVEACPENCLPKKTCDERTGLCLLACKEGYYGPTCKADRALRNTRVVVTVLYYGPRQGRQWLSRNCCRHKDFPETVVGTRTFQKLL